MQGEHVFQEIQVTCIAGFHHEVHLREPELTCSENQYPPKCEGGQQTLQSGMFRLMGMR